MKGKFEFTIQKRMTAVILFFLAALAVLSGRLFLLQIVYYDDYVAVSIKEHPAFAEAASDRGTIYAQDKNGNLIPLALDRIYKTLVLSPRAISDKEAAISFLTANFSLSREEIETHLQVENDPYEVLVRKLDSEKIDQLTEQYPPGIFFEDDKRRFYPHGTLASHVLGFVGQDAEAADEGKYGLERFYNDELAGNKDLFSSGVTNSGFFMALGRRIFRPPQSGARLILTLDYNIQATAEEVLEVLRKKWGASSGEVLVLDPKTGQILALAGSPHFDPGEFSREKDFSVFLNSAVELSYELGSVMKPMTMAAGIEEKLVSPTSTYEDTGEVKIGGYRIKNFDGNAYHVQTMTQVLEKSLNTGAVYVGRLLGKERQLSYLRKFGFGAKTGIDLPGEVQGNLSNLDAGRDIDFATASFGQGIAITPLQLAVAMGALGNGGVRMKPYIVKKIIDDSGNEIEKAPVPLGQAISKETAEKISQILVSAVRNGFENRAGIKGYFVAGKTGTAQIPKQDGKGYSDKVIHTFVGYAPAFDPRFLVLLQLNEPTGNRFASNTLTPAFHDLAEYILNYYEVPTDEK